MVWGQRRMEKQRLKKKKRKQLEQSRSSVKIGEVGSMVVEELDAFKYNVGCRGCLPELALDRCKTGRRSLADRNIPVRVVATLDGGPEDSGPPTAFHWGVSVPVLFYF